MARRVRTVITQKRPSGCRVTTVYLVVTCTVLAIVLLVTRMVEHFQEGTVPNEFQRPFESPREENGKTGLLLNTPKATPGYTLLAPMPSTTTYLIDIEGNQVHSWESNYMPGASVYLLENGNLLRTCLIGLGGNGVFSGACTGGRIQEFAWDGSVLWDFKYSSDRHLLHHDIEPLPNGNVLMVAWERKTREEAIAAGRVPDSVGDLGLWSDHLIEVEPTRPVGGRIVWEWHVWDHLVQDFDAAAANYGDVALHVERIDVNPIGWLEQLSDEEFEKLEALGYLASSGPKNNRVQHPDWTHINSVAYNAELDQIALSVRGFNELWIIDHSTTKEEASGHKGGRYGKGGDLLYRWGNPRAYHAGSEDDQVFFAQHDVRWIPRGFPGEGNLLAFNNGTGRTSGAYSSVIEIAPPIDRHGSYRREPGEAFGPEEPDWEYVANPKEEFFSMIISGAQRLPSGNTLVCSGVQGDLFEVTQSGEVVWHYTVPPAGGSPFGPGARPFPPEELDTNGDGLLSFEELSRMPLMQKPVFDQLDRNGDGALAKDELPPLPGLDIGGPGQPSFLPGMSIGIPRVRGGSGGSPVFRAYRYARDYPGLEGKDLRSKDSTSAERTYEVQADR